jgi:hypothetical protein
MNASFTGHDSGVFGEDNYGSRSQSIVIVFKKKCCLSSTDYGQNGSAFAGNANSYSITNMRPQVYTLVMYNGNLAL